MALPTNGIPWIPQGHKSIYRKFGEHSAWYSGDARTLSNFYQAHGTSLNPGGMHWGQRRDEERRVMLHVPIAGDIASTSADLLFSEAPRIRIPKADEKNNGGGAIAAQDRLDEMVNEGGLIDRLLEAGETGAALGGVYLKPNWDMTLAPYPVLGIVQADNAIPEFKFGILSAVTFWRTIYDQDNVVYRHLERYEPGGVILHGLYKGSSDNLGDQISLDAHPETSGLLPEFKIQGLIGLATRYVPNMRPNRLFRESAQGRSDYAGAETLMDALDETFTSWMRDVRLAKARIIVPDSWLSFDDITGSGKQQPTFDIDRELFVGFDIDPLTAQKTSLTANQFAIRVDEHERTALELVNRIVSHAGYSPQTFGLKIDGRVESGVALNVRERKSYVTKSKKERYFKSAIEDVLEMMMIIDNLVFKSGIEIHKPSLEFQDSQSNDIAAMASSIELLNRAQAVSTKTKVTMLHPDWTQEQIDAEVQEILKDTGIGTVDVADLPV